MRCRANLLSSANSNEKVRWFINEHSMLEGATGVVVAVSGGPDSVSLLDLLARLTREDEVRGSEQAASKCRLHIAHLDHMLRGRESENDARFVRALADKMGLEITIGAIDIRAAAKAAGRGIEETAREEAIRLSIERR